MNRKMRSDFLDMLHSTLTILLLFWLALSLKDFQIARLEAIIALAIFLTQAFLMIIRK
ncbi:MAG: hypothetical protein RJQ09_18245 [Cyclobacteriaceae bacterium]